MSTIQEMVQEDIAKLANATLAQLEGEIKVTRAEYRALMEKEDIGLDENRRINFLILKIDELEKLLKQKQQ